MKQSFRLFVTIFVIGLISQTPQAQAQTDTSQFHFPLEVGTIWVYQLKSAFITEECGFGCPIERWVVVERTESEVNGVCGRIEAVRNETNMETHEFSFCLKNEQLTRFPATEGGFPNSSSSHLASEVMADFSKSIGTYWPTPIAFNSETLNAFKRNEMGITNVEGDITVDTYVRENDGTYNPGSNTSGYYAEHHTYRPGVGFLQFHYWHQNGLKEELRGAVINGAVIGDTTFVYTTSIDDVLQPERSERPALLSTYPNPFNPSTQIRWTMDVGRETRIAVYDVLGREVKILVDGMMPSGQHSITFDAAGLPSGMYVVVLESGGMRDSRKITLLK